MKYINIIIIMLFVISLSLIGSSQISLDNKDTTIEQKCYTEYWKEQVPIYKDSIQCYNDYPIVDCKDKDAIINTTSQKETCYKIIEYCYPIQVIAGYETVVKNETICKEAIIYKDDVLEYERENKGCTVTKTGIICDDDSHGDGNGDGICQSGETCHTYELTRDNIKLLSVYNGMVKIQ